MEETQPSSHPASWLPRHSLPQMRSITSPLQWAYCMFSYIAVACPDGKTKDMLAYAHIVLHLAQKHGGMGWLEYDRTFCQQVAADPSIRWNAVNPPLMASAVLCSSSATAGMFCHHCQEVDHMPRDCALVSADPFMEPTRTCSQS